MTLPYHENGYIYFEMQTDKVVVFDPANDPGIYVLDDARPGNWRLSVDAIKTASEGDSGSESLFSVDCAQIFIIDFAFLESFLSVFDPVRGAWPDYDYFNELRDRLQIDFGYLVAGGELAEHFDGDGGYVIDKSSFEHIGNINQTQEPEVEPDIRKLMVKIAKNMKTFVCTICFEKELICQSDPEACVKKALQVGWTVTREPSDFGAFSVYCPSCHSQSEKH